MTLRFSADEVEAWKLDAERSGFGLATFLKARIRDGSHYAQLTKQVHALRDDRRRDLELLKAVLAHAIEGVLYARELAYPQAREVAGATEGDATATAARKAAREAAFAARQRVARRAAVAQVALIFKESQ